MAQILGTAVLNSRRELINKVPEKSWIGQLFALSDLYFYSFGYLWTCAEELLKDDHALLGSETKFKESYMITSYLFVRFLKYRHVVLCWYRYYRSMFVL
jgi:hypothetical protein